MRDTDTRRRDEEEKGRGEQQGTGQLDGSGRLLDLGCGPGTLTLPLAPHFAEVAAIDPDEGMIAEARKAGAANVDWRIGRAADLSSALGRSGW